MKRSSAILFFFTTLLLTLLMAILGCAKTDKAKKSPPTITSFTITATTMTTATLAISASNYTSLSISVDGGSQVGVAVGSHTIGGLTANKNYVAVLTATNASGVASTSVSFTTAKSSLAISSFLVSDTLASAVIFNFTAISDATITTQSLINDATKVAIDITGKTSHLVYLNPNTNYSFTYTVKDNTGNEVSRTLSFKTKEKLSSWFSISEVKIDSTFAIIGNAVSSKLTIRVNNSAGMPKSLNYLSASFGSSGKAVKMLRYSLNSGSWKIAYASTEGLIALIENVLQPGENVFECYFALRASVGVANGSALSFTINGLNDGESATLPVAGVFPASLQVGSVNAITEPTIITSRWDGYMYVNTIRLGAQGGYSETGLHQIINVKATGPQGARIKSIKLKNPYSAFTGLEFKNDSWSIANLPTQEFVYAPMSVWQGDYVNLVFPNVNKSNVINSDGATFNGFYIYCKLRNTGSIEFNSGIYTPGLGGLVLTSKYDLVIINADGQMVDLSDVFVRQEDVELKN